MPLTQETADSIAGVIGTATPFVAPINPLIPLGLSLLATLIKEEPRLEGVLKSIFSSDSVVTADDIEAAIVHVKSQNYAKSVPHSNLPPEELASSPFQDPSVGSAPADPVPVPETPPQPT